MTVGVAFTWIHARIVLRPGAPDEVVIEHGRLNIDGYKGWAFDQQGYLLGEMVLTHVQSTGVTSYELTGENGELWTADQIPGGCGCG